MPDLDALTADVHAGIAPGLVRDVHARDADAVQARLSRLTFMELRALVVVLADLIPDRVFDRELRDLDRDRPVPDILAGLVGGRP